MVKYYFLDNIDILLKKFLSDMVDDTRYDIFYLNSEKGALGMAIGTCSIGTESDKDEWRIGYCVMKDTYKMYVNTIGG